MTNSTQKKIAVLLTNNDQSSFAKTFPNDGEKVVAKLRALRPGWEYAIVPVAQGEFPASPGDYDGYVITGSPSSINDPEPWVATLKEFIAKTHLARIQMVGFCFGHQALAAALGGKVGRPHTSDNHGWGLGFASTEFSTSPEWMQPSKSQVRLLAAHGEQVLQLPPAAVVIGSNAFCPVAAMVIDKHIFSTEYHPEMSVEFMDQLVTHLEQDLPASVIKEARDQLVAGRGDDSALFMQWVVNFFEQAR